MTTNTPPDPHATARWRGRAWLTAGFLVLFGSTTWWLSYSAEAVKAHEARVIAGDFPAIRLEAGKKVEVDEHGRVAVGGYLQDPPLSVGSTRLIPRGTYKAMIVANDGVPAHVKKTELVIAAQDEAGAWHPATAPQVLARLKTPHPGSPL
jgi:hypothetical protein